MNRVLVTGGAGFIGSHTVDLLLEKGLDVTVLDNLSTGNVGNLQLNHPNLKMIQADVLNEEALNEAISHCDAVLHLAALASVPQSIAEPVQSHQVNTLGFLHVLQAIRKQVRSIRLVYASSAAVYGNTTALPCSDDNAIAAKLLSPYALEKKHNEDYAALYNDLFHIPSLALRYFNVYGLRQDPSSPYSGVISRFLEAYQTGHKITVLGDGKQSRDFINVSDVARANYLALTGSYCGALNIATGVPETLLNLIHYIDANGVTPADIHFEPARPGDIYASYASTKKAQNELKFKYTIPLAEGIKHMMQAAP